MNRFPEFLKQKSHVILYFICIGITAIMLLSHTNNGVNEKYKVRNLIDFTQNWSYELETGEVGTTNLPGKLPKNISKKLVLRNQLPELKEGYTLYLRARHVSLQVYVDGEKRIDNITNRLDKDYYDNFKGIYYQEVPITKEDSLKEVIIIYQSENNNHLSNPGTVYLGERGSIFLFLLKNKWGSLLCDIMLFFLGISLFILWLLMKCILKNDSRELACLWLFSISVSLWLFTESDCIQFIFSDTGKFSLLAYELLMLMPVPMALFFSYYSSRRRGIIASNIAATIPLIWFVVNNLLHILHVVHLSESMIISQIILALETIYIAVVQVIEIRYKCQKHESNGMIWKIPLFGITILTPLAILEILKYIFIPTKYTFDGVFVSIGVLFYMVSLAIDNIVKINIEKNKLAQTTQLKTQFLANMSHEIRTPLNSILGFNELIFQKSKEEKIKKYASDIRESGIILKGIVNSILDISKIESGKLEIYEVEYNTVRMIDRLVSMAQSNVGKKGLKFYIDIDPNIPETLIGDESHIVQVLTNILSNAIKYTKKGSVTFIVKLLEMPSDIPICRLLFAVKDTGIGIREEDKQRLFEKYERLDRQKNYSTEGTGLGMNIVVNLLKAMNTQIEVDSVYGVGSTFSFELVQSVVNRERIGDFALKRQEVIRDNSTCCDFTAPEAKLLVVDDVQMNLDTAKALLEDTKMQIDTAMSGDEAINKIREMKYDMVLMDHMMPGKDGIETTEIIRKIAEETGDIYYATLPIIALTANAVVGMKEKFLQIGMQDFVSKPIELDELYNAIKKWLPENLVHFLTEEEQYTQSVKKAMEDDEWANIPECVDIDTAKEFQPTYSLFEHNIKSFKNNFSQTYEKISTYRNTENVHDYTIVVHGLKSTSKMIGLMELSELARQQEAYCNTGEVDKAWLQHDLLLEKYKEYVESIENFLSKDWNDEEDNKSNVISQEKYEDYIRIIKEAAFEFDMQKFMELEEELADIQVSPEKLEEFEHLKQLIGNASFGEIQELYQENK